MRTSAEIMLNLDLDESCITRLAACAKTLSEIEEFEIIDLVGKADTNDIVQYLIALGETTTILKFALHCVDISFELVKEEISSRPDESSAAYELAILSKDQTKSSLEGLFRAKYIGECLTINSKKIQTTGVGHDAFGAVNAAINLSYALQYIRIGSAATTSAQKAIGEALYAISGDEKEITLMRDIWRHLKATIRNIDNA